MSSSASEARDIAGGRLGGARADFVASLGRKVGDARTLLTALEDDPSSIPARDELRRRVHALGTGARLLRFEAMARTLQEVLAVLDRSAQSGGLQDEDVAFVAQSLDDLPALVWGDTPPSDESSPAAEDRVEALAQTPVSVLVVGGEALADALTDGGSARAFECERTEDVSTARELARAYAPDLVLIDADLERAVELTSALLDDPLTEPVPIVIVGTFREPEDASRFVALGVARSLARPVTDEVILHACEEVLAAREDRTMRVTLGEPTLEQLAERLSQELKGALVDGVDPSLRGSRVPLGEGTEVLGALWGAIARLQEIIGQKTGGTIRFAGGGPEGAIALAPWLHHDVAASDRAASRGRGAGADVRLNGRRVVVADDDPGVTWFIADLLRTAGCEVHEALDGITARDLAFKVQPELVVSDILMPGLDGFALCRALKRDVALRDTPVILLSWKEDLLQRVRELGASAAAYMRKESDSRAVLARVREVLRPRARIEARLRADGEVRGRLDGLSPRLLLDLVCTLRRDARVAVRDATCLYEIEIRGGAPRRASRTASDGGHQSGEPALARLLGVGAGRFVVASSADPVRAEMSGTLFDILARPLAAARGALVATTGARMMEVDRILLEQVVLDEYLAATPDPARALLRQLAHGASPRQMVMDGAVSPSLMEDVLSDLAARCAIRAVEAEDGTDLLLPAVTAAFDILQSAPSISRSVPPSARPPAPGPKVESRPASRVAAPTRMEARPIFPETGLRLSEPPQAPAPDEESRPGLRPVSTYSGLTLSEPPPAAAVPREDDDSGAPSSLEDAVMRELSDRSPAPGTAQSSSSDMPPIIEPSELRPRSSNPPANRTEQSDPPDEHALLPSIPPDAIVPETTSIEELAAAPAQASLPPAAESPPPAERSSSRPDAPKDEWPASLESARSSSPVPSVPPPALLDESRPREPWGFVIAFALLLGAVAAVLRVAGGDAESPVRPRTVEVTTAPPAVIPTATTPALPPAATAVPAPDAGTPARLGPASPP